MEPRNHGKTTAVTDIYATWIICTDGGGNYPNPRILLIGESKEQAVKRLSQVKSHLETNPRILRDFGNLEGKKWVSDMIYCKRSVDFIDPTLEAVGVGGAITGGHFTHIIVDDPVSKENSKTDHLKKTMAEWFFYTVMPMLNPNGIFCLIGTRKRHDDLYWEVLKAKEERGANWDVIKREAIIDEDTQEVLWKERMDWDELMEEKKRIGLSAFASEYMNNPVPPEGLHFKAEWIQWIETEQIPTGQNIVYHAFWDPAFGKSDIACNNAIAVVGRTPDNKLILTDMIRFKGDLDLAFDELLQVWKAWKPRYMYIESNFSQKVLIDGLKKISLLPVVYVEQHTDKLGRIQSLEPFYAAGRIWHRNIPNIRTWVQEEYLPFFTKGVLVDGLDALASCIEQIQSGWDPNVLRVY